MLRRLMCMSQIARVKGHFDSGKLQNFSIRSLNREGILADVMKIINKHNINLTYVESELHNVEMNGRQRADFNISSDQLYGYNKEIVRNELREIGCELRDSPLIEVSWYPRNSADLNAIGRELLTVQEDFGNDSQQFTDPDYRARRNRIADLSIKHNIGQPIPIAEYSKEEEETWKFVYKKLEHMHEKAMCSRYNKWLQTLNKKFKFSERLPQLRELDQFLQAETGFRVRPTMGILSQREFLNSFAHRIFCSTQYIRHHSNPEYTPEPDIVHEIVGHIPMFCDPVVCDISQQIGLLSLGATDDQISQLGHLYWFTIQFGACREDDGVTPKGYGAGIGSSYGEMQSFLSGQPRFDDFVPIRDAYEHYPVQKYQQVYKVAKTFQNAMDLLIEYGKQMSKPTNMYYDFKSQTVLTDRGIFAKTPRSQRETDKSGY